MLKGSGLSGAGVAAAEEAAEKLAVFPSPVLDYSHQARTGHC